MYAGASLHRDALDDIMVSDARNGEATFTGSGNSKGFINSQDDVKSKIPNGWPDLEQGTVLPDTDGDGMPDDWETAHGLNPNDKNDGNTKNEEGYTNLEVYLNSLVAHITDAQNEGGELWSGQQTTDIAIVQTNQKTADLCYYNLQGMKVNHPQKGLYIQNGKKIIIR